MARTALAPRHLSGNDCFVDYAVKDVEGVETPAVVGVHRMKAALQLTVC